MSRLATTITTMRLLALACAFIIANFVIASDAAAQPQDAPPVTDLGQRTEGETYPFNLKAVNLDCTSPQDFRFDLSGAPWIIALQDPVARQLAPAQSKTIEALLDFGGMSPGAYNGQVDIFCETCGVGILTDSCQADRRSVLLSVTVVSPTVDEGANPEQSQLEDVNAAIDEIFANAAPEGDIGVEGAQGPVGDEGAQGPAGPPDNLLSPITDNIDPEMEKHLDRGQKEKLDEMRRKANQAARDFVTAQEEYAAALKKKKDCEDELEALKAALAKAQADAAAAKAAADAAQAALENGPEQKAVDDAQKAIDNFQNDVDAAQREYDRWVEGALAQQKYLEIVIQQEGNLDSQRGQNAKRYYEEADANRKAAKAALEQVQNSMPQRQAALTAAQNAYNAAQQAVNDGPKKAAADAQAKVDGMVAGLTEKEKECLGLKDAADDAALKKGIAEVTAEESKRDAKKAEKKAKGQAKRNLKDAIKKKKDACERIEKEWDTEIRQMTNALKALEQTGYYKAGQFSANKASPDRLWTSYKRTGLVGAMKAANVGGTQFVRVITGLGGRVKSRITGPLYDALLKSLQIAYGVATIRQSELTPGTYAHGRTEGKSLRDWLRYNNFAWTDQDGSDARAVEEKMRKLMNNRNYIAEQMARAIQAVENCKRELAEMEAQLKDA